MKSTGIIRKVDELGRIVIPMEVRQIFGINTKEPLEIYTDGDKIVLSKYERACTFCSSSKNITMFKGRKVCEKCVKALASATLSV